MRLAQRFIGPHAILDAVESYEIVESYPDREDLPSYLVLGRTAGDAFHVVFAVDLEGNNVRVVTAYRPSVDYWRADMRTRRVPK
jgi:hypothetical protein